MLLKYVSSRYLLPYCINVKFILQGHFTTTKFKCWRMEHSEAWSACKHCKSIKLQFKFVEVLYMVLVDMPYFTYLLTNWLQAPCTKSVSLRLPVVMDCRLDDPVPSRDIWSQVWRTKEDAQKKAIVSEAWPAQMLWWGSFFAVRNLMIFCFQHTLFYLEFCTSLTQLTSYPRYSRWRHQRDKRRLPGRLQLPCGLLLRGGHGRL